MVSYGLGPIEDLLKQQVLLFEDIAEGIKTQVRLQAMTSFGIAGIIAKSANNPGGLSACEKEMDPLFNWTRPSKREN